MREQVKKLQICKHTKDKQKIKLVSVSIDAFAKIKAATACTYSDMLNHLMAM